MSLKIPNSIIRRVRNICFKTKDTLLRHVRGLFVSHQYSAPIKRAKRRAALYHRDRMRSAQGRRHREHRECCAQAYLIKRDLVARSKGHNTLCGIPA